MTIATRTVTEDEADIRLDRWFRRHYPGTTQGVIQKLCRTGQVRVDGRRAEPASRLAPGQTVRVPPLPVAAPPKPAPAAPDPKVARELEAMVLWQDEQLIVLNKPSGLATQGGPGITRHLDQMLEALRPPGGDKPRLVHRLDRDTSGVLVVARTAGVAAKLAAAFRGRDVEKVYWAVVAGRPVPVEGRIDHPLTRSEDLRAGRIALAEPDDPDAARAVTDYRTLDHAGRKLAWLELRPLTGRTHQLRVHCTALGAPILGDVAYGPPRGPADPDRAGENTALVEGLEARLHLHARRLVLPHPAGGRLVVEAELPPHMQATFRTLGFTAPPPAPPQAPRRR
ncbi:Pseudouridine synthase [Rhodovastum atsumiense]|uniref:Pseudouridine synthase n=1 Tax=Rhodovastum atsumiense TaxID=504468 RepID=A0A5M6ISG1_9PROT|nr:RluA family pseudouridine synthase [Rhodovastum atsumiense]KAA5611250.1 RluA family pseudouridine synthase [Rhodovastum atsumiense]CAH2603986.1 Pseudouridine synthase [Rhodovastum atsumiense]